MNLNSAEMDAEVELHRMVTAWCLIRRRKGAGLSQVELAEKAYVSRATVQHTEHARHGLSDTSKLRICTALGISTMELDAEIQRVKFEWLQGGPPKNIVMPNSLASKRSGFRGAIVTNPRHRHASEI